MGTATPPDADTAAILRQLDLALAITDVLANFTDLPTPVVYYTLRAKSEEFLAASCLPRRFQRKPESDPKA